MVRSSNEIVLCRSAWWIVSRDQTWGPFDYQWSADLSGIEFTYQGEKFGEVCGADQFFADLSSFRIPISLCRVAAIVAGSLAVSVSVVEELDARASRLSHTLDEFGFGRFAIRASNELPEEYKHRSQDSSSERRN